VSEEDGAESVYRTIHDLPSDDRPGERLLAQGTDTLSAAELVAVVVASGTVGENAVDLARRLMNDVGGLPGLVRADAGALRRVKGLGPAKTAQILAAIELGRRVQQIDPNDRPLLITPEAVFGYMNARLRDRPKEELHVLSLDTRGRLLGAARVIEGGVSSVGVRPAEVFSGAHGSPRGIGHPRPQSSFG
jgi:DNA repair protein RadC